MVYMTRAERVARAKQALEEGRIIQGQWTKPDFAGRQMVCALAAFSPEVAAQKSALACPADLMPSWLAEIIPWIDDAISPGTVPAFMRSLIDRVARFDEIDKLGWDLIDRKFYNNVQLPRGTSLSYSPLRPTEIMTALFAAIDTQLQDRSVATPQDEQPPQLAGELPLTIPLLNEPEKVLA